MDDKYFIPDLSDIRVGYECEFHAMTTGGLMIVDFSNESKSETIVEPNIKVWYPIKCGYNPWSNEKSVEEIKKLLENNQIRTPYLTKKQIEAEKWENIEDLDDDGAFSATKTISGIIYKLTWTSDKSMQIWDTNFQHCVYFGSCPSINEFRFICKLLNI